MSSYIVSLIGEPPPRPPNVGSKEREEWEARLGPAAAYQAKKDWQDWFNKEQEIISRALGNDTSGRPVEDMLLDLGYENAHERGATVYSRYPQEEADRLRKEAFARAIQGKHYEPFAGAGEGWYHVSNNPDWRTWETFDNMGKRVPMSASMMERLQGAYGLPTGQSPTAPNAPAFPVQQAPRPYLNVDDSSFYRGYRSNYLGRPTDKATPSQYSDFEVSNRAFGLDQGIPGLNKRSNVSGLSNSAFGLPSGYM